MSEKLNSMCESCGGLFEDCDGTTNQTWTGCVHREYKGRYQVITYSEETGADEKLEYGSIPAAERAARSYVDGFDEDDYDAAIVFDLKTGCTVRQFGCFPDKARPAATAYNREEMHR